MIRVLGFLVGIVFAGVLFISLISGVANFISEPPEALASDVFHKEHKELHLASDGPFGKFDLQQLQRGFQVYKEVCSACHSLRLVAFRDTGGRLGLMDELPLDLDTHGRNVRYPLPASECDARPGEPACAIGSR